MVLIVVLMRVVLFVRWFFASSCADESGSSVVGSGCEGKV